VLVELQLRDVSCIKLKQRLDLSVTVERVSVLLVIQILETLFKIINQEIVAHALIRRVDHCFKISMAKPLFTSQIHNLLRSKECQSKLLHYSAVELVDVQTAMELLLAQSDLDPGRNFLFKC
jgi:hypothetical protein